MPEILYRKWRPRTFSELAGQEPVATTLVNALATDRVAHAYLFTGPRGTGKTTTGRLLAKVLNCTDRREGDSCNKCESCLSYLSGRAMDLIELDAASNRGIDEIRGLRDKVAFAAGAGEFKVYLIDEVHMLTEAAFNALLKTLEEPPPHVVFILATTDGHKVPATIISRCQRFDFRRMSVEAARGRLRTICEGEGFAAGDDALELIARSATGSMRDAVNLLDQLVTSYGRELSLEHVKAGLGLIEDARVGQLARAALHGDLGRGLELIAGVRDDGLDLRQFQRELVWNLRNLLLTRTGVEVDGVSAEERRDLAAAVDGVAVTTVLAALKAFGEADLKPDPNSTLPLDLALASCALTASSPAPAEGRAGVASPQPQQRSAPVRTAPERPRPAPPPPVAPPATARASTPPPAASEPPAPERETAQAPREPGPEAAPAARESLPPPAPVSAGDLDSVRRLMPRIYEDVRKREFQLGALLNSSCDIIEVSETEVTMAFRFPAHAQRMAEAKNSALLAEAFSQLLGKTVAVRCVADAGVDPWTKRAPSRSPLVRAAQEMGARIVNRDEE